MTVDRGRGVDRSLKPNIAARRRLLANGLAGMRVELDLLEMKWRRLEAGRPGKIRLAKTLWLEAESQDDLSQGWQRFDPAEAQFR